MASCKQLPRESTHISAFNISLNPQIGGRCNVEVLGLYEILATDASVVLMR